jgi:hypothetical protein
MYLSGKAVADPRIGVMLSYNAGKQRVIGHKCWAADNGCFSQPKKYSDDGFLSWLDQIDRTGCLFAVAPDVVADAAATLDRAAPMLPKIRRLGFAASLVGQDGATPASLPWPDFDALFIGGSTRWKLSGAAADLILEAKRRGKHCHMGRVNSWQRIRAAAVLGCHSVDGTFIAFGPDKNTAIVVDWLDRLNRQQSLFSGMKK